MATTRIDPEHLKHLRSRLRDLKKLYARGLVDRGEMVRISDELEDATAKHKDRDDPFGAEYLGLGSPFPDWSRDWAEGALKVVKTKEEPMPPKKKADDVERELVKNILADVLTNKLGCKRAENQDAYRLILGGIVPRVLLMQDSVEPAIECLESLKRGMIKIFDDAIDEIRERNEG